MVVLRGDSSSPPFHRCLVENLNKYKVKPVPCPECQSIIWCTDILNDENEDDDSARTPTESPEHDRDASSYVSESTRRSQYLLLESSEIERRTTGQLSTHCLCVSIVLVRYVLVLGLILVCRELSKTA
uniref:Uncharacterized protein n=1 Tax=Cacopsylla melanoneura TaxID=428564 RepID=A0A8D8U5M2_9HEMI